jgi:leucyl-tRNA---protein transferase
MVFINEYFMRAQVAPEMMDQLWARGWRHFGESFFR